jgi:hypothetical protein
MGDCGVPIRLEDYIDTLEHGNALLYVPDIRAGMDSAP